ncbi:hypothetical protein [Larkinella soli]|uniref:hypothetical protein n=1 Tax=Larkinella soli TaxID=1770527 RepID=UPI000FFB085B|nr:hypothetical protein [Larkinella soli]
MKSEPGLVQKVSRLFDQHWEHRILWTRIIFSLYYKLTGELNYIGLTLIGFSGLLLLGGLLYRAFRKTGLPVYYFLPVTFWLFTLQSHENLTWAMASIQNFHVLVFIFGAYYLLALNTRPAFFGALIPASMACFTSGNGILCFVAGAIVLVLLGHYKRSMVWALAGVVCAFLYFFDYQRINFFPSAFRYGLFTWVKAFFVFPGGFLDTYPYTRPVAIGYNSPTYLTFALGLGLFASLLILLFQGLIKPRFFSRRLSTFQPTFWDIFFGCGILFLLGTDAMLVYARVGFGGAEYMLQGRYKVYSPLFLSLCYLYFLWRNREDVRLPAYWAVVSLITIPVSLYSDYQCLESLVNQQRKAIAGYLTWRLQTPIQNQKTFESVFPRPDLPLEIPASVRAEAGTVPKAKVDQVMEEPFYYQLFRKNSVNPDWDRPEEGSFIILNGRDSIYVFPARPLRPYSLPDSLMGRVKKNGYFTDAFQAQIPKESLKPGTYRIGLLTSRNRSIRYSITPVVIRYTTPVFQ